MKKLFYFLMVSTLIFIIGCNKNENLQSEKEQSIVLPDVNLTEIVENFGSEQATFASHFEYAAFMQKFRQISEKEQQELLKKIKYKTINKILDKAYAGMDNLENREEFVKYLKQYKDYLELIELPNGEEEVVENEITKHSILPFLNKYKIIKIGNIYQKYLSNICVESTNLQELLKINNETDAINSRVKYFTAYTTNPEKLNDKNKIQSRWRELNLVREWTVKNDKFWCKNKRKATFSIVMGAETYYFDDPIYGRLTQVIVARDAEVVAKRKGIACIWYRYKTKITWNDFHSEYDFNRTGIITHEVWKHANETKYAKSIRRFNVIYVYYPTFRQYSDVQWTQIKTNATTRGIWPKWIEVDEYY